MAKPKALIETNNTFSLETACKSNNVVRNLEQVIQSHPDNTARSFGMSIVHLFEHKTDELLETLKLILKENPTISLLNRRLAEALIANNEHRKAIPYLEMAVELNEEDLTAVVWLSLCYSKTGNPEKTEAY
jgi:predicted Zn-dependent protease